MIAEQDKLKKAMKALGAEINQVKNDDINYAAEGNGVNMKKDYSVAKSKFDSLKKRMGKLSKRLGKLKPGAKNDKTIKSLTYKLRKGTKRLTRYQAVYSKLKGKMLDTPAAKAKRAKDNFKRASGTYTVGWKKPTGVIKPLTGHTDKAVAKINSTRKQTLKVVPVKKVVSVRSTTPNKKAQAPKRKLALAQATEITNNVTAEILGFAKNM